jgi:radical SAM protein with 4Fe4S-binding SPASM domain
MLRPDFADIFEYITGKATTYSLNTNGSLITPALAKLLRRKGSKMVALYGATAEVCDHITRTPGSFEQTMRGIALLKEAGAGFIIQLVPMRDNYHQWQEMIELAESLSKHWRVGAAWLYLRADGDGERNREIRRQRLTPGEIIGLSPPNMSLDTGASMTEQSCTANDHHSTDDRLFANCIPARRHIHIDPYGHLSFCPFVKEPALRYDLRNGNLAQGWDTFIPGLTDTVRGGSEFLRNCPACELRGSCGYCPAYSYLEHRDSTAKIDYLCSLTREKIKFKKAWRVNHRRWYQVGGLTVKVDSDLPITDSTFAAKFEDFRITEPTQLQVQTSGALISINHHFKLPEASTLNLGKEVKRKMPWAIYRQANSWIYFSLSKEESNENPRSIAIFNNDHTSGDIFHTDDTLYKLGGFHSLTMFSSDQIVLSRVLAERQGCYFHSSGAILNKQGFLFVGQSGAGKSTISRLLEKKAEVLCDDRNIIRCQPDGYHVYGTWSHGEWPVVSSASAPLRAIFFIEQAAENRIIPACDNRESIHRLLGRLIKPLETADWWNNMFNLMEDLVQQVPCYTLRFDTSGSIVKLLQQLSDELR